MLLAVAALAALLQVAPQPPRAPRAPRVKVHAPETRYDRRHGDREGQTRDTTFAVRQGQRHVEREHLQVHAGLVVAFPAIEVDSARPRLGKLLQESDVGDDLIGPEGLAIGRAEGFAIAGRQGARAGAVTVAANSDPAANPMPMVATALLPLGVELTMIPALKVGENDVLPLQFRRCVQRGCEAVALLDEAQLAGLRAGTIAKVAAGMRGGKTAVFEFSLNGFAGAYDAMKKRLGKP